MPKVADKILSFYQSLHLDVRLPKGIEVMNPYQDESAFQLTRQFYQKYYSDQGTRRIILGINPGRFGGGLTGIPFTDPILLETQCGIANTLDKRAELSATFIYKMIEAYGGPDKFYTKFFVGAISPLGFTQNGKNLNYYDSKELNTSVAPFVLSCMHTMLTFGIDRSVAYCLGEGKNFQYLQEINDEHRFFDSVVPLPHPRFIMQYKRKELDRHIQQYVSSLSY